VDVLRISRQLGKALNRVPQQKVCQVHQKQCQPKAVLLKPIYRQTERKRLQAEPKTRKTNVVLSGKVKADAGQWLLPTEVDNCSFAAWLRIEKNPSVVRI
jgi:hypothetical protein